MNIVFDPTVDNQLASYNYDDGGMPATKEHLIKDGVLVRGLGGIESQIRSGIDGVSNLRASSWNRIPIDRMANINLEPGVSTKEEIIGSIERGVCMLVAALSFVISYAERPNTVQMYSAAVIFTSLFVIEHVWGSR